MGRWCCGHFCEAGTARHSALTDGALEEARKRQPLKEVKSGALLVDSPQHRSCEPLILQVWRGFDGVLAHLTSILSPLRQ